MLSTDYIRDVERVKQAYRKVGTTLVATEPVQVMVPESWVSGGMAVIEDVVMVLGIFAIITSDNKFASTKVTGMVRTEPDRISTTMVDDVPYLTFFYERGSSIISSTDIVVVDIMVHPIWTILYGRAKVPWYLSYEGLLRIFHNTGEYNGTDGGSDPAIWSYMGATICRDPKNPRLFYRQSNQPDSVGPVTVPLVNVSYNADSLVAKLSGSYFDPGVTAGLARPSKRADTVESILRYK